MPAEAPLARYADLDWLRVAAILLLLLFHTGMMFNVWTWHVKNDVLLPQLTTPWTLMHLFRMPLLMVVAGAGTALALRRRNLAAFARERTSRLLLPLVVGMLVVVPPQIYVERLVQGICHPTYLEARHLPAFHGSYLDFYPSVFRFRPYPEGSLSWHHLWFVAYLFVYSLLALPLFAWLRRPSGLAFLARAEAWLLKDWRIFLLFAPLALARILFRNFPETLDLIHDPKTFSYFAILFLYGHLLGRCPALMERVVGLRWVSLGLALLLLAILLPDGEFPFPFEHLAVYACVWLMLLAALGHARHLVRIRRPWLAYAQEVIYPFYILHQTVIVLVGYRLLRAPLGPWTKMGAVLVLSLVITAALCEVIRRVPVLRPLFGMKARTGTFPVRSAVVAEGPGFGA